MRKLKKQFGNFPKPTKLEINFCFVSLLKGVRYDYLGFADRKAKTWKSK